MRVIMQGQRWRVSHVTFDNVPYCSSADIAIVLCSFVWPGSVPTIPVRRRFPGRLSFSDTDPSLLLDNVGSLINAPEQAKRVTWHPHRAVKTVSYVLDSEIAHHDTNGGVLQEGDTQWMMAGAGILLDGLPTKRMYRSRGAEHVVQLWVTICPGR
jgi:redox-sensitive bicupin YhaK (pirin superfamily)